ncbi:MAG TPA: tRNA lysidine(34) synthetase TilS [Candidatus Limnocylindrales bacterium]|nr:tRNA lysidine(34) synthetase TilS [Candidatus Limnocylindrales bacterium]
MFQDVRRSRLFSAGDRVAVAVSGGADSVALLRILEALRESLGITLMVAHLDHCLRGDESDRDARFVSDLSNSLSLELVLERKDVATEAKRQGWNLEDAGRRVRYAFLEGLVEAGRVTRVAVAHTADDQAETVLAHVIRGTGPTGLGGIHPKAGSVVRPLLAVRRADLREYLQTLGQSWCEDSTNRDVQRMRSRVRTELVPVLQERFSSRIVERLCELAHLAREEDAFWSALVEDRYREFVKPRERGLVLPIRDLLRPLELHNGLSKSSNDAKGDTSAAQRALTERLVRRLYEEIRGDRKELTARHVEQVIRLAEESDSGRVVQLPGGVRVERGFDELLFHSVARAVSRTEAAAEHKAYEYVLKIPSAGAANVSVPEIGSRFCLKLIDWGRAARETKSDQILDADSLRAPLILRNWRPGDAYTPQGRRQARKLNHMLSAARVPRGDRSKWPVLESAGSVIWARGLPAARGFGASSGTRVGLVIEELELENRGARTGLE